MSAAAVPDSGQRPHWVHSDGRPYDELDLGRTRFVDEADVNAGRRRRAFLWAVRERLRRARRRSR